MRNVSKKTPVARRPRAVSLLAAVPLFLAWTSPLVAADTLSPQTALDTAPQVVLPVTFTVESPVTISEDRIVLTQVAQCSGDERICEEAYGVDLGPSPAPGKLGFLRRDKLVSMLRKEWPEAEISVEAPAVVKLDAAFVEITAEQIKRALVEALATALPMPEEEAQDVTASDASESQSASKAAASQLVGRYAIAVDRVQLAGAQKVRPGDCSLQFPALAELADAGGDWLLKRWNGTTVFEVACVDTSASEVDARRHRFTAQVRFGVKQRLPVLRRNLLRAAVVTADDIRLEWVRMRSRAQELATSPSDLIGRRLKRAATAGLPVALSQVEVPPVVAKNQIVKLRMQQGGFTVTGKVKTLSAGGYGQAIEAIYPETKKRIRVRVVDQETVEYLF